MSIFRFERGKVFADLPQRGHLLAYWKGGSLYLSPSDQFPRWPLSPEEASELAAFLAAGPPKPKWRITRVFDERPGVVEWHSGVSGRYHRLDDQDMEEVWDE